MRAGGEAKAHGTPVKPAGRTFPCRQDGLTGTGEIKPVNPACKAAAQASGTTPTTTARWVRGESATFGHVVSGSGGDSTTTLSCRVG